MTEFIRFFIWLNWLSRNIFSKSTIWITEWSRVSVKRNHKSQSLNLVDTPKWRVSEHWGSSNFDFIYLAKIAPPFYTTSFFSFFHKFTNVIRAYSICVYVYMAGSLENFRDRKFFRNWVWKIFKRILNKFSSFLDLY